MGCYDTVLVPCPKCGVESEFQSKGGECLLRIFKLDQCPPDVLLDVNRHAPNQCAQCGTTFSVVFEVQPAKVVKAFSAVDTGAKNDPLNTKELVRSIKKETET